MKKVLKVDFFKIRLFDDAQLNFGNLINQINQKPREDRVEKLGDHHIWLSEFSVEDNLIEGELARLSMDNIPLKGDTSANIEGLGLNSNQGIVETMAFLFDTKTNIFLRQVNQNKIIPPRISSYITKSLDLSSFLTFEPVLKKDAYSKFSLMERVTKFELSVAGLDKFNFLGIDQAALGDFINLVEKYKTPSLCIALSTGRFKSKTLDKQSILDTITTFLGLSQSITVKKIIVDGRLSDDEYKHLNFLKDRMREEIQYKFTVTESNRHLLYPDRKEALRAAFYKRQQDLNDMFSS